MCDICTGKHTSMLALIKITDIHLADRDDIDRECEAARLSLHKGLQKVENGECPFPDFHPTEFSST